MNFDIVIVIAFLLLNLVVGLGYGKGVKTIKDYALGGRNFSTGALVATIVATWASGSAFFITLSKTYTDGLPYVFAFTGEGISFILLALFLVPRMGEFLGKTSIAEAMGELYGTKVRVITAIAGTIGSAGVIAVQFKVFGNMFSYFLHLPGYVAVISAGMITTLYSAFGGIRAVTFTDVLQFFTFGVIIPLVGFIIWSQFYHDGFTIAQSLEDPKFNIGNLFNSTNPEFFGMITMFMYFMIPTFSAPAFQRIAIGRSVSQVQKAFFIAGLFLIIINLMIAWIPFLLYTIDPSIASDKLLGFIVDNYSYSGLKGLIIVAIIAFAMSTADSRINSSTVLFTNDICKVFAIKWRNEIFISRVFAFALGIGAIALSLFETDILGIIVFANSFYYPIVTPPFLMTVFGFRSSAKSVLIGIAAGFIVNILWKTGIIVTPIWKLLPQGFATVSKDMVGVLLAMCSNVTCLLVSHYILEKNGGWVGVKDTTYLDERRIANRYKKAELIDSILNFNINKFLKRLAPTNDLTYTMVGVYFIICTFTTMYSTQAELLNDHGRMILVLYQIMMITGTIMAMYPIWPQSIKLQIRETAIRIIWPVSMFYMLILLSTFFVLVSNFTLLQIVLFVINLMIATLFFGWRLAIFVISIGFYLGIVFYQYCFATYDVNYGINSSFGSPEFMLMYVVLLVGTTLIMFLKPKQEYIEVTERKVCTLETEVTHLDHEVTNLNERATNLGHEVINLHEQVAHYNERTRDQEQEIERLGKTAQKILNNVNHELRLPIGNVINFSDMLHEALQKSDNKLLQELSKEVYKNSNRVSSMILNMLDLATLDVKKVDLQKTTINFSELVKDRVKTCRKIYLQNKAIDFELRIDPEVMISVDPNYMRQTVDNLVINAISFSETGLIKVVVSKQKGQVIFTITDQGKGIPPPELSDIFTPFKMGSNTESKADGRGVGLALCKSAVEAHGGKIMAESDGKVGATVSFVLPLLG